MNKILPLALFLFSISFFGQSLSDYNYVRIPSEFKDAKANKYDLDVLLASKLKAKKYESIDQNKERNLVENQNSCQILKAELTDVSNMFTNKIKIDFKDCNEKLVATFEGKSKLKDFDAGMRDALENALLNLPFSKPDTGVNILQNKIENPIAKDDVNVTKNVEVVSTPLKEIPTTELPKTPVTRTKVAEVYTNGKISLNRIILSKNEFILANPNNAAPYAIFRLSTKKDIYRVQLTDGTTTLGYIENDKIVIEVTDADGILGVEIFAKK